MGFARIRNVACGLLLVGLSGAGVWGNTSSHRQYYSSWHKTTQHAYYYRNYYYKPSESYYGYKHHYTIFHPQRPQYLYYYNPYSKKYWGRCPAHSQGKGQYSLLAEADRRGDLEQIPETAFPRPGKMPPIPESTDDATMDLPPDDLPTDASLPR
jgi:hypothetical protein